MQRLTMATITFGALAGGLVVPGGVIESADAQTQVVHHPKPVHRLDERVGSRRLVERRMLIEAKREARQARREARRERREARREAAQAQVAAEAQAQVQEPSATVPSGTSNPSGNRRLGQQMMLAAGWGMDQWGCLDALFTRESGWSASAYNPSGAYGIPQALPGDKMASAGADWRTNPATQIRWGLGYISGRYGSPCGAWSHSEAYGWY
jgi:uncharacterized membrane protein